MRIMGRCKHGRSHFASEIGSMVQWLKGSGKAQMCKCRIEKKFIHVFKRGQVGWEDSAELKYEPVKLYGQNAPIMGFIRGEVRINCRGINENRIIHEGNEV